MPKTQYHSLKFQVSTAMLAIVILFTGAKIYTFVALQQQQNTAIIIKLATRLQLTAEQLATQGMNYKNNAPRDFEAYTRDLNLYYRDLKGHVALFDQLSNAFMTGEFSTELTGLDAPIMPKLGAHLKNTINRMESVWLQYRESLFAALGPSKQAPRLEYAAEFVTANHKKLELATNDLANTCQHWADMETANINLINRLVLLAAIIISGLIVYGFYRLVLTPLSEATVGFRKIAQGDFSHQIEPKGNNEITELTQSLNYLSRRLNSLFRLIGRIQDGSNLNETLAFVSQEFHELLKIEWAGVVFVTGDGGAVRLETSYLNGEKEQAPRQLYRLEGTFLQQTLDRDSLLHIPDMLVNAREDSPYEFLRMLVAKGMKDAVFLPLSAQSPMPGVLVFSTRNANTYTGEQLDLLTNIAQLITHSFGKTARLTEHSRLAAIGEFASGIAHEIRNPLATICIALDYLDKQDLPGSGNKRTHLAIHEAERMTGLLEDMLLYAKPFNLEFRPIILSEAVSKFIDSHQHLLKDKAQTFHFTGDNKARLMGEPNRLTQVFLNLAKNACEAAPEGSLINWSVTDQPDGGSLSLDVKNEGEAIPVDILPKLSTPFFTTKVAGTGLGLGIVKRITEAHGGELRIFSNEDEGTRVQVILPRLR